MGQIHAQPHWAPGSHMFQSVHGLLLVFEPRKGQSILKGAVLARVAGSKLLVLGDMGELGSNAEAMHAEVGAFARDAGVTRLFTLGELSAHAAQAFGAGARHFTRIEDLLAEVGNALAPDVTMLVKGSRFMQMERVVRSFEAAREPAAARTN